MNKNFGEYLGSTYASWPLKKAFFLPLGSFWATAVESNNTLSPVLQLVLNAKQLLKDIKKYQKPIYYFLYRECGELFITTNSWLLKIGQGHSKNGSLKRLIFWWLKKWWENVIYLYTGCIPALDPTWPAKTKNVCGELWARS